LLHVSDDVMGIAALNPSYGLRPHPEEHREAIHLEG